MFNEYKKTLRRLEKRHWHYAHLQGLQCVPPWMAKNFFRHCRVPGCESFPSSQDQAQELLNQDYQRRRNKRQLAVIAAGAVKRQRQEEG
jgi:hypothetical protein